MQGDAQLPDRCTGSYAKIVLQEQQESGEETKSESRQRFRLLHLTRSFDRTAINHYCDTVTYLYFNIITILF